VASEATRERLLDAAEELFSENGFDATSVRAITSRAGVHLAAMNYHFGSKDALIQEVFQRRVEPMNQERIRLLDEAEAAAGEAGPELESILEAFIGPAIRLAGDPESGGREFMRLMGRIHSESGEFFQKILVPLFRDVLIRFKKAFAKAVPDLRSADLFWRIHFTIGAMAHTTAHAFRPLPMHAMEEFGSKAASSVITEGMDQNVEAMLSQLISFSAAGFRAAVTKPVEVGEK
jgi:AcrR family transcriptional regulator